jgi:glucose/arabinose dehydrogenase
MMALSMASPRAARANHIATLLCSAALVWACASPTPPTVAPTAVRSPTTTTAPGDATPTPVGTATSSPIGTFGAIALRQVATGLHLPLYVADAGDVAGRLFVVEQSGRIMVVEGGTVQPTPFLDLSDRITNGGERGLLSVAFSPDYTQSGRFFVDYTNLDGDTVIERFARAADGTTADAASGTVILTIKQPASNHNGGLVLFGPDGMLYIGMGDGGGTSESSQEGDTLLGKMLRLDVHGDGYAIPPDNPFVGEPAVSDETWALGLRNPWRFSFDRETADLWIGDVGGVRWEEVDFQAATSRAGENYGWPRMEGPDCGSGPCDPNAYVLPVAAYRHTDGNCVVTGGYVYRGSAFPELRGSYLYGDYCSGRVWALNAADTASGTAFPRLVLESGLTLSSFGEDRNGELYLTDLSGGVVYKVVGAP